MSPRALLILAVAAVVLTLLAVLGQRSNETATPQANQRLLSALEPALDDLERVSLVKAGNESVATLERQAEGWVVAERDGYPADFAKLRQGLTALAEARIVERKTANPELYDRIGVADVERADAGGVAIELEASGTDLPAVIIGDAEGTEQRYVRIAGEAQSYLIDRNPDLPRNTEQWLAPQILDVRGPRVHEVVISHPDGETVRVFKEQQADANFAVADIPEDRELSYAGVANVIGNALRELNLEDVQKATDVDAELTTFEYRTFDGLVVVGSGFERDDEAWVTFAARFDPELAARFGTTAEAAEDDEGSTDEADATESSDASERDERDAEPLESEPDVAGADPTGGREPNGAEVGEASRDAVRAEAEEINQRVAGWRYRIASYQYDQMTRRMDDLLKAAE